MGHARLGFGLLTTCILALTSAACRVSVGPADDSSPAPFPTPVQPSTTCDKAGSGTLAITISGLPAGTMANAAIDGASGRRSVTTSGSIQLDGGAYLILADSLVVADPIVGTVYKGTAPATQPCVKSGEVTNVEITYAPVPTSNKLWALNANGSAEVLAYSSASLHASGAPAADISGHVEIPRGLAFDRDGGMWATARVAGESVLAHYTADSLASSGDKTPDITIGGAALSFGAPSVTSIAFDGAGNLWVSAPAAKKILRFDASQLTTSGSPDPAMTISSVDAPSAIAFDPAGNLWAGSGNAVVEYAASRLTASTSAAADIVLSAQTAGPTVTPYQSPSGLAFDASGNLWVDYNGGAMVRFTAAERAASATVTPTVQVTLDVTALAEGVAFDESGGLWFAHSAGKLARLGPTQLAASATVTPSTIIASASVGSAGSVALYPAPSTLPIFGKP